jgi:BirA family biotin operon repressor/biotin-[acetyl-CoA-carboxylase] ligase
VSEDSVLQASFSSSFHAARTGGTPVPRGSSAGSRGAWQTDSYNVTFLRQRLRPFRLHWFPRLRSTNDHAAALRKCGRLFAPAVVLTGHQIAGRGRGSNTWWSRQGSLTVTFVLPIDERIEPHQLPLLAGLAVRNAATELTANQDVQLKWPNDILYRGKKLGGLLCERVMKADLVGVGVNVNLDPKKAPVALRDQIMSLSQIRGAELDMTEVLAVIAAHLRLVLTRATDHPFAALLREYDAHHALVGKQVCVTDSAGQTICGKCEGLDPIGRLLLRHRGKLHHVISGQVRMR